ncbi:white-opaque regulator 1 [Emergomyces africanus]|uniref:White-opaque regulator 1 n=1 Tax=Emergomyces africanus TaxID=1955775 RepID=A0A1B7NNV7_9EURO|nr:white-opaque regulator 1 [Emergomyces africanus]
MGGSSSPSPQLAKIPSASPAAPSEPTPKNVPQPKAKGPRRRTKTGCLTCRKRRIKCGEEKPTCNNCKKSKRDCEGYAQRVIFRNPVGPMSHIGHGPMPQNYPQARNGGDPLPFISRPVGSTALQDEASGARPSFIPLAPRPNQYAAGFVYGESQFVSNLEHQPQQIHPDQQRGQSPQGYFSPQYNFESEEQTVSPHSQTQPIPLKPEFSGSPQQFLHDTTNLDQGGQARTSPLHVTQYEPHKPSSPTQSGAPLDQSNTVPYHQKEYYEPEYNTNKLEIQSSIDNYAPEHSHHHAGQPANYYYEEEIDDYYDVETDEEMEIQTTQNYAEPYEIQSATTRQLTHPFRTSTAFLNDETSLMSYTPSPFASPLMDPEVTRIFCHFITSVAPMLSIFERHPVNPTIILSASPVPASQQSLWTYTVPTLALRNQGLLQAILALSSHHIAKIQGLSLMASFRHYHYAIRRVSKAVKLPGRRKQTATLAATLLLGFYEVMSAEHSKWNSHVAGASQLIQECDFARMTRDIRSMRTRAKEEHMCLTQSMPWLEMGTSQFGSRFENDLFADKEADTNDDFISTLMGRPVNYNNFGNVQDTESIPESERNLTAGDVEEYRIRSDLYWFYSKQDVYQAMISGDQLLIPYNRWGTCPPRSGVGKLDAVYASNDHLILLLARTTDFAARDRSRKVKVRKQNGGQWRPPPGYFPPGMGRGPHLIHDRGQALRPLPDHRKVHYGILPTQDNSPPMYGMIPSTGPVRLPSGFAESARRSPSPKSDNDNDDLETQTENAEAEWKNIAMAYEAFENALGPGFKPLPPDSAPPIATPFGPALQYRTHTIACVWALLYTGRIILERAHPGMPPEAMVAAGICAFRTGQYANSIGRIVAGIYYPQQFDGATASLIPSLSAVLTELLIPLFYSGVQYTDAAQRGWTIAKLRNIARLTGGSSATAVASGCETAWTKAFEAGKGPHYQRTMNAMAHVDKGQGTLTLQASDERKFVTVNRTASLTWAMGLLSLQGDYTRLMRSRLVAVRKENVDNVVMMCVGLGKIC